MSLYFCVHGRQPSECSICIALAPEGVSGPEPPPFYKLPGWRCDHHGDTLACDANCIGSLVSGPEQGAAGGPDLRRAALHAAAVMVREACGLDDTDPDTLEQGEGYATAERLRSAALALWAALRSAPPGPASGAGNPP